MGPAAGKFLTLIAGVALGALGAGLLFQALDRPAISVEAAEPKGLAASSGAPAHQLPIPRAHEPLSNRGADPHVAADESSARRRVSVADDDELARSSELLATLNAAYARGEVADDDLVQLLFNVFIAHGNAEAALDLVTRFRPQDAAMLVQVAVAFSQLGLTDRSREIIERALAVSPDDEWVLNQYAGVDSKGALPYFLARLSHQEPPGDAGLRLQIAQLYLNAGNSAEARAQVDLLLREDPHNPAALQLLSGFDPAAAERFVRDLIAGENHNSDWDGFLFQLVLQQGRTDDAVALLESRRALGLMPESGEYGSIAQMYIDQGKQEAAVKMWANAFDAEQGDPDSWTAALQEYAPQQLLSMLEARTAQGANDEFWGALGDSYWHAGRKSEALNAWREASRLDPEDGEWTTKLAAVAAGRDPM